MRRLVLAVFAAGLGLLAVVPAAAFQVTVTEEEKLVASDGAPYDKFGVALSVSGDTAVIGASSDDDNGYESGSAYVFTRSDAGWGEQAKLNAFDSGPSDKFGHAVGVSGDTAVIGSRCAVGDSSCVGSVYVYTRTGTTWTQQAELESAADDAFGFAFSVAISGDTVLVGAPWENELAGFVYVFTRSGDTWTQQAQLGAEDAGGWFGYSVDLSEDSAVIGSPNADGALVESGAAYVFTRSGDVWSQQAKLYATEGGTWRRFGTSVAIDEDTVIVGEIFANGATTQTGAAHVFTGSGSAWTEEAKLVAADGAPEDWFGGSVAILGDAVVVGAQYDDIGGITSEPLGNAGSAYVFASVDSTWIEQIKITAPDAAQSDRFGGVAASGSTLIVGANGADGSADDSGAAYVFNVPPSPDPQQQIDALKSDIRDFVADDALPRPFGHRLTRYLDTALRYLERNDETRACETLTPFFNNVGRGINFDPPVDSEVIDFIQDAAMQIRATLDCPGYEALSICSEALPTAFVGTDYLAQLEACGGTAPYTWRIESGDLPAGLSLATNGTISGTPTTATTASVTFGVTDTDAADATATLTIKVVTPVIALVSVATDGTQGNSSPGAPAISADGRYVAFKSAATNLVTGDSNEVSDIFLRDLESGTTIRVSVSSAGIEANGISEGADISADGRSVVFFSQASNLVAGDTNATDDVFVRDVASGETARVSVASDGSEGDAWSLDSAISGDGRIVVFSSYASNLVEGDTNGADDVFVHDRDAGTTTRVSVSSDGSEGNGTSRSPVVSDDGRYVAFGSSATNLVEGDTNGARDIFVHDRDTETTARVSVGSDGGEGDLDSWWPAISGNGRFVAFNSPADFGIDSTGVDHLWLHDRDLGTTELISVAFDGGPASGDMGSYYASISENGSCVAFSSGHTNLVAGDVNDESDVFVRDIEANATSMLSLAADGRPSDDSSWTPAVSGDCSTVAFHSRATNLVPEDMNGHSDIFVVSR